MANPTLPPLPHGDSPPHLPKSALPRAAIPQPPPPPRAFPPPPHRPLPEPQSPNSCSPSPLPAPGPASSSRGKNPSAPAPPAPQGNRGPSDGGLAASERGTAEPSAFTHQGSDSPSSPPQDVQEELSPLHPSDFQLPLWFPWIPRWLPAPEPRERGRGVREWPRRWPRAGEAAPLRPHQAHLPHPSSQRWGGTWAPGVGGLDMSHPPSGKPRGNVLYLER